ncbi:MAG: signal peptidase I [Planctomycetota bacterium]|jgi:signal peptidase I|nr:signal peptidase I [Planctomycetota bacterium]MDP6761649.1 signal peptidase I [Planctomycetota bacterium]MDP6989991.1 signal peptidase I [Planctomycetota bacterium]
MQTTPRQATVDGAPSAVRALGHSTVERLSPCERHELALIELGLVEAAACTGDARTQARPYAAFTVSSAAPAVSGGSSLGRWLRRTLVRLVRLPLGSGALVALLVLVAFNLSVVHGSSMKPGILDGDRILIDRLSIAIDAVDRGDVVVLSYPLDPSLDYIKRVIGLPGDEVLMAGGRVWVNGELLAEPYITGGDTYTYERAVVEEGHYFVLGDNRPHSADSREFGQVPRELLRGRVDLRVWPPKRAGRVR